MPDRSPHRLISILSLLLAAPGCQRAPIIQGAPTFEDGAPAEEARASDPEFYSSPDWTYSYIDLPAAAPAGDVNGDGYDDVLLGYGTPDPSVYGITLYLGSADGLPAAPAETLLSLTTDPGFQIMISHAGDFDGDGYDDVGLASIYAASEPPYAGEVRIYRGSADGLETSPAVTLYGADGDAFGRNLSSAGDVNGDGYDDLIVGAPGYVDGTGRAYLYLGSADGLSSTASATLFGDGVGYAFGVKVVGAGDVNGDGYDDVAVLQPKTDAGASGVFVFLGASDGLSSTASYALPLEDDGDLVGLAGARDVNGDGYGDILVSTYKINGPPDEYTTPYYTFHAYVYEGSPDPVGDLGKVTQLNSDDEDDNFGCDIYDVARSPLSGAGDVNGDGYDDVVIGAGNANDECCDSGTFYLFLGSPTGISTTHASKTTGVDKQWLGERVGSAGDLNGDGYADVFAVGDPVVEFFYGHAYATPTSDSDTADDSGDIDTNTGGDTMSADDTATRADSSSKGHENRVGCGCADAGGSPDRTGTLLATLLGALGMRRRRANAPARGQI